VRGVLDEQPVLQGLDHDGFAFFHPGPLPVSA